MRCFNALKLFQAEWITYKTVPKKGIAVISNPLETPKASYNLQKKPRFLQRGWEPMTGLEPVTCSLRVNCSTN